MPVQGCTLLYLTSQLPNIIMYFCTSCLPIKLPHLLRGYQAQQFDKHPPSPVQHTLMTTRCSTKCCIKRQSGTHHTFYCAGENSGWEVFCSVYHKSKILNFHDEQRQLKLLGGDPCQNVNCGTCHCLHHLVLMWQYHCRLQ